MMKKIREFCGSVVRLSSNKKGQGMVEYGLIIVLVAVVVIAALTPLGNAIAGVFNTVVSKITG